MILRQTALREGGMTAELAIKQIWCLLKDLPVCEINDVSNRLRLELFKIPANQKCPSYVSGMMKIFQSCTEHKIGPLL